MEIGFFQLENLIITNSRFTFLDLRASSGQPPHPSLAPLLARAVAVSPANVNSYLRDNKVDKNSPVVLLCEDGRASQKARESLETLGFLNVYVVERGVEGLLSEL